MQKILLILLLFCFSNSSSSEPKEIFTPRPFIILFDSRNETISQFLANQKPMWAITADLLSAIIDEAAPILVSKSIMHNFLCLKKIFGDFVNLDSKALALKYQKYELFKTLTIDDFKQQVEKAINSYIVNRTNIINGMRPNLGIKSDNINKAFSSYLVPFISKDWIVKDLNQNFYLLIPRKYLVSYALSYKGDVKVSESSLLKEELEAGIKFQHFDNVSTDFFNITESFFQEIAFSNPFYNPEDAFISTLKSLFIPVVNYKNIKEEFVKVVQDKGKEIQISVIKIPQWNIYFGGHGSRSKANLAAIEEKLASKRQQLAQLKQIILSKKYVDEKKPQYMNKYECVDYLNKIEEGIPVAPPVCGSSNFTRALEIALDIYSERSGSLGTLAGLPLPIFTQALLFFNDLQATSFLLIFSCFAAGENLRSPYLKFGKKLTFNYTIVSQAITEETTASLSDGNHIAYKVNGQRYALTPAYGPFFDVLLKKGESATKKRSYTFIDAIAYAAGFFDSFTGDIKSPLRGKSYINNLAWIRSPGTDWFSFAAYRKKTVIINQMLAEKYAIENQGKKEKEKKPFVIDEKALILLNISTIDFPLQINKFYSEKKNKKNGNGDLPQILSILPGSATHKFNEKVIINGDFQDCLQAILRQDEKMDLPASAFPPPKFFYLNNLECRNKVGTQIYTQVLVFKYNLTKDNKVINQIYAYNNQLAQWTYLEWDVSQFTLQDKIKNFQIIDLKKWQEGKKEFDNLEKNVAAKFEIMFRKYEILTESYSDEQKKIKTKESKEVYSLKKAFEAAQAGKKLAIERVQALKKYQELLKKSEKQADQWLELQSKALQFAIKSMQTKNKEDVQNFQDNINKLFSLNVSLNILSFAKK